MSTTNRNINYTRCKDINLWIAIDAPLRMGWWPCCSLFWPQKLLVRRLQIAATKSLFNNCTYKTTNCWCSVDAHFNELSIQHLLPSIIVLIMIWTYWLSFSQIVTWPCGKIECSNILALFALRWPKVIYPGKRFIAPAIHLNINQYSQATAHHTQIICLKLRFLVMLHKEAGETLTHSDIHFLRSLLPSGCIVETIRNKFSACVFDFRIVRNNLGTFGVTLTFHRSGHSWSSSPVFWAISV